MENKKNVLVDTIKDLIKGNEYVSEIETNSAGTLFYKERGKRKSIPVPLKNNEEYKEAIDGLIEDAEIEKNDYLSEGRYRLPGNKAGRLHIVMPPVTPTPLVTLAIISDHLDNLTAIQNGGTFDTEISRFLKAAVNSRLTIAISGGTGAGKTTLLRALTDEFDKIERIGVCEDSAELQLTNPNTAYLTSTTQIPGMKHASADLAWLVKQINRMRVDRIIIGETRGKEFFDFITAANSGAEGSLTTIHTNDAPSALQKMATFMYQAVDMSPRIINEMISSTLDIVIQLGHNKDTGEHKIISIHEVTNAMSSGDSPTIALNPLFEYNHMGDKWEKRFPTDNLKAKLEKYNYNPNSYSLIEEEKHNLQDGPAGLPSYFKGG